MSYKIRNGSLVLCRGSPTLYASRGMTGLHPKRCWEKLTMGLGFDAIDAIFREHKYRPINGDVVIIGRQTVYFSPNEILDLMRAYGIPSALPPEEITLDTETVNRRTDITQSKDLITDTSLFKILGVKSIRALDHSDYEGAEIVHDLMKPLPNELRGIADFIVDGSTLDNVFSPATAIKNFADLLRPGGRILMLNMLSNDHEPYTMLPPLWYLDYFAANRFLDCKVYILVFPPPKASNAFCINLDWLLDANRHVSSFVSPHEMAVLVFAEKGEDSTADIFPAQQHYRSDREWSVFRKTFASFKNSPRPHLTRSRSPMSFFDVRGGYLFMNDAYEAVDPGTEAGRIRNGAYHQGTPGPLRIFHQLLSLRK